MSELDSSNSSPRKLKADMDRINTVSSHLYKNSTVNAFLGKPETEKSIASSTVVLSPLKVSYRLIPNQLNDFRLQRYSCHFYIRTEFYIHTEFSRTMFYDTSMLLFCLLAGLQLLHG